ncbi:alkaline phosphatase D family protein [Sphingomonas lenta]|uniref:Alkaline phosphatase n=1 Tax=Sphingomonas lenta TaxID=1141887 RepID=A0A2A2SGD8_9SPHN|nr:alkaline phosphatase D family protein [Sphingomonas lenta]PAX08317.1 alkaline phosphatase [Sphingomonas lenta]
MTINRRQALATLGSGAALTMPSMGSAQAPTAYFHHGIASGDPARDGAVIWTRATPAGDTAADVPLRWHVATAPDAEPVRSGRVSARAARDYTVKVEATGLKPGRDYHYWFEGPGGVRSAVGRFRTLPVGATPDLVMAVASCSLYPGGYFNAYRAIADLPRVDVVLHLGDYIYEYGEDGYGAEIGRKLGRIVEPRHEIVTLADYRARHAQVKADPDAQAMHARAATIAVWDDHEVTNDGWLDGAQNHQPATEGDWKARKAAAMQAYFEWMPIRDPKPGRPWEAINRSFEFGDLATLAMVETRLLARSEQVAPKGAAPAPDEYASMLAERADPKRELLGEGQRRWLETTLARSKRAGKPWQLLGNQVLMARINGPDLEKQLGPERYAAAVERLPEAYRARVAGTAQAYRAGLPFNFDSWDGYPPARERLYQSFARAGVRPVVLAGDSHASWANDLHDASDRLVAAEFGATAVTSPSYGDLLPGIGTLIEQASPEVAFCDQDNKGYLLLTLTPEQAVADFQAVSTVTAKPFTTRSVARYATRAVGEAQVERIT